MFTAAPYFCIDNYDNYNPGATDPDGDSLSYALVSGLTGSQTCGGSISNVNYVTGYTDTRPVHASSFSFNPATAQISFYPDILQTSLVVYNIEEYRRGASGDTLIGTSQREAAFIVLTCSTLPPPEE